MFVIDCLSVTFTYINVYSYRITHHLIDVVTHI